MEKILLIAVIALMALCIILYVRYRIQQREIRSITIQIIEKKDEQRNQPVTVGSFGAYNIELVNALNAYIGELEERLKEYEVDREHMQRIIAGISHDFRTPLTSVDGYLQLIEKSDKLPVSDSDKERKYLDVVISKVRYLRELSDDFLDLSVVESSDAIEKSEVSLVPFVSEIILAQNEWIEARGIETDFDIPDRDIRIVTNEHDLRRILENVFSNMRKYAHSRISFCLTQEETSGVIRISVENDVPVGYEIDVSEVFEPFVRTADRHGEGSGLGLYVVKKLCDKLGYEITARFEDDAFGLEIVAK